MPAVVALIAVAAVAAPAGARALSAQVVSCSRLHLAYSFQAGATSFPISVSGSDCTDGATASTTVSGSGTGTFTDPPVPPIDDQCPRGADVQCLQYALTLAIGGTTASPTFDTRGYVYPPIDTGLPASTFDFAEADTIVDFTSGHGAGALNSVCVFVNPEVECTGDGAFTWTPGL